MAEKKRFVFAERKRALQVAATCGLSVIEEQQELRGYQIYVVEQWVCDRKAGTNVVKVFTGDESHVIQVAVIAISTAELQHPRPEIQTFLNMGAHLKSKPTPLGEILLTNPGELPDMNMVLIPDGDYDKWLHQAYVNINLRRTNCTGRSSLNLKPPNPASEEKFRSLYKIADTVDFQEAVIKLVSLVQTALYLFKLLDKDYIDGLICNETTNALWIFYTKYDPIKTTEFTLKEPWMEPHLAAAIISKLMMCRNKLQDYNFTALKDPFADYDTFRFDIGDYQRSKNIRTTKFIDLETLAKLNEHPFVQLKVRKVIKSKLDDISGITNSPLFNETSDPEVFRHHATIDSVRAIWRPRLKGNLLTSGAGNSLHLVESKNNMIKSVSRTGGAAVDILSRVAGSIPWINTNVADDKQSPSASISTEVTPVPTSDLEPSPTTNIPNNSDLASSLDHLDQDIPSYVQSTTNSSTSSPLKATIPKLRVSKSTETHKYQAEGGDFVPYKQRPSTLRHTRSVSDSILLDSLFSKALDDENDPHRSLRTAFDQYKHQRSQTTSDIPILHPVRPASVMNVKAYLTYERLCQQKKALQHTLQEITALANVYDTTAAKLRQTYEKRAMAFEIIQSDARNVLEEQHDTERRLKDVEDDSAKLHYELKVLNDKLKDIEDNVGTFYGKVGVLERRMDDSQQSITTMLIIGNYLNHYWIKIREWINWFGSTEA